MDPPEKEHVFWSSKYVKEYSKLSQVNISNVYLQRNFFKFSKVKSDLISEISTQNTSPYQIPDKSVE